MDWVISFSISKKYFIIKSSAGIIILVVITYLFPSKSIYYLLTTVKEKGPCHRCSSAERTRKVGPCRVWKELYDESVSLARMVRISHLESGAVGLIGAWLWQIKLSTASPKLSWNIASCRGTLQREIILTQKSRCINICCEIFLNCH